MPLDPWIPPGTSPDARLADRLAKLEREVRDLQRFLAGGGIQAPVVTALPTFGRKGRLVVLASDNKLYLDTGAAWVAQT